MAITSIPALEFLESMIFWDEKRPITVEILRRLSFNKMAIELGELAEYQRWAEEQQANITEQMELGISERLSQ